MKPNIIILDEYHTIDKNTIRVLEEIGVSHWSGGMDFGHAQYYPGKFNFKKEKKMSKITNAELQRALEAFAEDLGLEYSPHREEFDGGKINDKFLPKVNTTVETEVTKETKEKRTVAEYYGLGGYFHKAWVLPGPKPALEATLLGKVNAIAEFLGVDFSVTPEHVVAEKVKAVKRPVATKTAVKVTKKGKK